MDGILDLGDRQILLRPSVENMLTTIPQMPTFEKHYSIINTYYSQSSV